MPPPSNSGTLKNVKPGSWFSGVSSEAPKNLPRCIVLCGASGLGKTLWAAQTPKPLFFIDSHETGIIDHLNNPGRIPAGVQYGPPFSDWQTLLKSIDEFIGYGGPQYTDRATCVFESITGFEGLMFDYACSTLWRGDWDRFYDYSKGPKQAAKRFWDREFLERLRVLRGQGYHVILTGHSDIKEKQNTEGADFVGEVPYCDKQTWAMTHRFAEACLMMVMLPIEAEKAGMKTKVKTDAKRLMYMTANPIYASKDRWPLKQDFVVLPSNDYRAGYVAACENAGIDPNTFFFA